ncbi:MAG: SCO family protein, partial [Pseudomonadota bacterium]|nr:SCO family protein [Pseudomonadota bacterium]
MSTIVRSIAGFLAAMAATAWFAAGHAADESLPTIGPAPQFTLTTQDDKQLSLDDLRGKVVVVTFIFASCAHTCPLLTSKMMTVQSRLGNEFGRNAYFVSVTVDPERDTPEVLKRYAQAH